MNIIFDATKLKHPNTGLYHFTKELALALNKEIANDKFSISFLIPKRLFGIFGNARYIALKFYHRMTIFSPKKAVLWHSTFQMSPYLPPKKVKVLITVHDLNFLYEKNKRKRLRRLSLLQKNIDRADKVVAISEFSKMDLMRNIDIKGKNIKVIYNGCNLYDGEHTEPKNKPQKPFLFSLGIILPKKNWHVLPCLLQDNDYSLLIAGKLSDYSLKIKEEAKKYGVEDRLIMLGEISEAEKHWYLNNCSAFLFPSIAEEFGLPVIEAMAYGKPIFLSQHTSLPEIGGKYAYYFDKDFNREKMKMEFENGMKDFPINRDIEEEKQYARSFSWERSAKEYAEIYRELSK
ncbi:MAG: glycosyltransferase family 4 protein [Bacteroidetes bacterium]|nr:glycosyltransferase family 4 protein [Bacteroidota bacterium]